MPPGTTPLGLIGCKQTFKKYEFNNVLITLKMQFRDFRVKEREAHCLVEKLLA